MQLDEMIPTREIFHLIYYQRLGACERPSSASVKEKCRGKWKKMDLKGSVVTRCDSLSVDSLFPKPEGMQCTKSGL